MLHMLLFTSVILLFFMTMWFLVSVAMNRNDIADILWGAGFVLVVLSCTLMVEATTARGVLMALLVTIWGVRLSVRIFLKNRGREEDFRYRKWREEWGDRFLVRSYFQVFVLQGVLMLLVLTPVWYVIGRQQLLPLNILDMFGLLVWCVGFYFEVVGDYQLDAFKKNPENSGKVLQVGLWKYSRHPNYFGEVVMWWGIYLMALPVSGGFVTIIGPAAITFLILKVSGIPLLEEHYRDNPGYQAYKEKTSVFFPLPPKAEPKR